MFVDQNLYKKAFEAYLRKGTPIELSIKQARSTTHYIWRTRNDGKVRSSHADREGQVFAWDDPPVGGHPGEDYNCRCRAEPLAADDPRIPVGDSTLVGDPKDDFIDDLVLDEGYVEVTSTFMCQGERSTCSL